MNLYELQDDFTPQQFMQFDKESLDKLSYDVYRWNCQCKKCTNGTTIRDYGIRPFYFLNRNSQYCSKHTQEYWHEIHEGSNFWLCGKHYKLYNRLSKLYGERETYLKLCDFYKQRIGQFIKKVNSSIEMIDA